MTGIPLNMAAKKFGRFLVIGDVGERSKSGEVKWWCICECGNQKLVKGSDLRRGYTKSCGCYKRELAAKIGREISGGIRWKNYTRIPPEVLKQRHDRWNRDRMKQYRKDLSLRKVNNYGDNH